MFFGLTALPEVIKEFKLMATGALLGLTMAYFLGKRRLASR